MDDDWLDHTHELNRIQKAVCIMRSLERSPKEGLAFAMMQLLGEVSRELLVERLETWEDEHGVPTWAALDRWAAEL